MKILAVDHVQITVPPESVEAARAFYCETLGLTEIEKPDALRGRGGFWLQIGGFQVHVGTEGAVERGRTKAHVAYQVDELERWRYFLMARGFELKEPVAIPGVERFEFRDPFGNRVELLQIK